MLPMKPSKPKNLSRDWLSKALIEELKAKGIKTPVTRQSLYWGVSTCPKCGVFKSQSERSNPGGACNECVELDKLREERFR